MKTILLMRHAKAVTGVPGKRDFDRSLAARGLEDASRMGAALAKLGLVPDAIVASPAARAKETAEAVVRAMEFGGAMALERTLYDAAGDIWLAALRTVPSAAESVLVVAHSPGVAEAAALLCGASPGSFDVPTGGLIALVDPAERWRDLEEGGAGLRWFLRPKLIERLWS
jgi:phosphohistidine phosphatase